MNASLIRKFTLGLKVSVQTPNIIAVAPFHSSVSSMKGWADFKDQVAKDQVMATGRGWTNADLRRKVRIVVKVFFIIILFYLMFFHSIFLTSTSCGMFCTKKETFC